MHVRYKWQREYPGEVGMCASDEGLSVNSAYKISFSVLMRGHVSVSLKIAQCSGEEEFLPIIHGTTMKKNTK